MRKLLFLTLIATLSFGQLFAQKSILKDAKRALGKNELNDARALIKKASEHEETANDPETWKVMGDIGDKAFNNEYTKATLGQSANDKVMYDGLMESYKPYLKADSLGQIPNNKGKVKNKFRKDIASILRANHPFYINAGVYYNDQKNYSKASDFFQIYWDIPTLPMYEEQKNSFVLDSTYQIIKYYAIITAIQAEEHERALGMLNRIRNEEFIENDVYKESDIYELLASEYYNMGDTAMYLKTLEEGVEKFPTNNYFVLNVINHFIREDKGQTAMDYIDQALRNDPSNACDLNSVKGALLADKQEYEAAEVEYRKALESDPNCERALEALAVNYILQAQDLREETSRLTNRNQIMENDTKTVELYNLSLPYLEKYTQLLKDRNAPEHELTAALMKLRNVYYNLSNLGEDKSAELEAVESQLEINQ